LTSSRIVGFIVALASLGLLLGGCPKPKPPPAPVVEAPAKPALSIEDVAPAETTQGVGVTVHLMGYGFVAGSEVELGGQKTRGVDVIDDGELSFRVSEAAPVGRHDIKVTTPTGDVALLTDAFLVKQPPTSDSDCTLLTVRFEFNETSLTDSARRTLAANSECMESQGTTRVQLVGHADERGSTLYNLSLGQRRADSVRQYLVNLGIDESRLSTLSYGEERPEMRGQTEQAWTLNRRVEFVVR
jgi:peptidoglycan-associated lipoprotein